MEVSVNVTDSNEVEVSDHEAVSFQQGIAEECNNGVSEESQSEPTTACDSLAKKVDMAVADAVGFDLHREVSTGNGQDQTEQDLLLVSDLHDDSIEDVTPQNNVQSGRITPEERCAELTMKEYSHEIGKGEDQSEANSAYDLIMKKVDMVVTDHSGKNNIGPTEDDAMSDMPQRSETTKSQSTCDLHAQEPISVEPDANALFVTPQQTDVHLQENTQGTSFPSEKLLTQQNTTDTLVSNPTTEINVIEPIMIAPAPDYEFLYNPNPEYTTVTEPTDNVDLCFPSEISSMNIQPIMIEPLSDDSDQDPGSL